MSYLHNVSSQLVVLIFINIVLLAFVTSVTYIPPLIPPVKFWKVQKKCKEQFMNSDNLASKALGKKSADTISLLV